MVSREAARRGILTAMAVALAVAVWAPAATGKGTAYVVGNFSTPDVDARAIGADGSLSALGTVPVGGTPRSVVVTPDARFAYVSDFGNDKILAYSVGPTGALSLLSGQPVGGFPVGGAAADPEGLATTPDGRFLFAADQGGTPAISAWSIEPSGLLTPVAGSPFGAPNVAEIAVSPSGSHLLATAGTDIRAFSISSIGALAPVGVAVPAGVNPKGIAITPGGGFAYVAATNVILGFSIGADGTLAAVGAPVPTGLAPDTLAISQDGRFVYVANGGPAGTVSAYEIGSNGSLTAVPGQPFAAGALSRGIDAGPGGRVYVADYVDPVAGFSTASVFNIAADGALTQVPGSPFTLAVRGTEFQSIAVTPDQGPTAGINAVPGAAGTATTFDAAGSIDNDGGTIQEFNWDFGDGDSQGNGGQTLTHVYQQPGTYTASVTVVDDGGCSTTTIFTGQTADCNGNPGAKAEIQVVVPPGEVVLTLSGKKKQKLDRAIEVGAGCDLACTVAGSGDLVVTTKKKKGRQAAARRTFKIKTVSRSVAAGGTVTLKLKLSKIARRAATKALNRRGRVTAKVTVKATSASGVETTSSRSIRLSKKKRK